ncbi:MAG: IS256 family transposase ISCysp27 [Legionellaceae bacterium]
MNKSKVVELKNPVLTDAITELLRASAREVIAQAVEAELEAFLSEVKQALSDGNSRIVRNGYLPEREILTGIGKVNVRVPRVRDRGETEDKIRFKSTLIPPYMRRTATLNEVLPLLYLKGISESDFVEVLSPIFGEQTKNLSAGVISRLKMGWEEEYQKWQSRKLDNKRYVYWWVDGVGFSVRDDDRRCVLVVMGVNEQGNKELISLYDGYRESTESWLTLLRDLKARGINTPAIAVGDGALGFWNALSEVFPLTQHQRCWFHKMGNVLDKLPKAQQSRAKSMLHEIWMSATREEAYQAFDAFINEYGAKYPKAAECLLKDKAALLTFYDFPAEHWAHLRTTNPIESTFATVRNRTYKVKGAFSNKTILTMAFKLMQSAQKSWIRLRGFHHLDNVIKGIKFVNGKMELKPNEQVTDESKTRIAA